MEANNLKENFLLTDHINRRRAENLYPYQVEIHFFGEIKPQVQANQIELRT